MALAGKQTFATVSAGTIFVPAVAARPEGAAACLPVLCALAVNDWQKGQ